MSLALFLITHEGIASNLLTIGEAILQRPNNNLAYVEIPMDSAVNSIMSAAEDKLKKLDTDDGVLFITDIYGSTPGNVAQQLATKYRSSLLSGVNLPMIIRLLNYRGENKTSLIKKALDGASKGIQHYQ